MIIDNLLITNQDLIILYRHHFIRNLIFLESNNISLKIFLLISTLIIQDSF